MTERDRLARLERQIHALLAFGEPRLPERIRRKQPVPARVPVGRVSRIARVIDDGERDRLTVLLRGYRAERGPIGGVDERVRANRGRLEIGRASCRERVYSGV